MGTEASHLVKICMSVVTQLIRAVPSLILMESHLAIIPLLRRNTGHHLDNTTDFLFGQTNFGLAAALEGEMMLKTLPLGTCWASQAQDSASRLTYTTLKRKWDAMLAEVVIRG